MTTMENDTYEPEHESTPEEKEELQRLGIALVPQPRSNIRPKEDLENFVEPDSWRKVHELDEIGIPYELDELFHFDYQDDEEDEEITSPVDKQTDDLFNLERDPHSEVAEDKANSENRTLEELFDLSSAEAEAKTESLPGLDYLVGDEAAEKAGDSTSEAEKNQATEDDVTTIDEVTKVDLLPMEKDSTESGTTEK